MPSQNTGTQRPPKRVRLLIKEVKRLRAALTQCRLATDRSVAVIADRALGTNLLDKVNFYKPPTLKELADDSDE